MEIEFNDGELNRAKLISQRALSIPNIGIAIDFGEGAKLKLYGVGNAYSAKDMVNPSFIAPSPKPRGASLAEAFEHVLAWCLEQSDTVVESASIGSSGAEPDHIRDIVAAATYKLYLVSGRCVKNLVGAGADDDIAVQTIYQIAQDPRRLRLWVYTPKENKYCRQYTSVRPYDKRKYKGPQVDAWFADLCDPTDLSPDAQSLFVKGKRKKQWWKERVMPLAMALNEKDARLSRNNYERVLGLYEHGFPSFYRRLTVALMIGKMKELASLRLGRKAKKEDCLPEERKQAWKFVRKCIREFYARCK